MTKAMQPAFKRSRRADVCGLGMWNRWREKDYQWLFYMDTWKDREAEEDLDGQCQRRPEGEKHRLDRIGEATRNREMWMSLEKPQKSHRQHADGRESSRRRIAKAKRMVSVFNERCVNLESRGLSDVDPSPIARGKGG